LERQRGVVLEEQGLQEHSSLAAAARQTLSYMLTAARHTQKELKHNGQTKPSMASNTSARGPILLAASTCDDARSLSSQPQFL
jgi:hypothetical protein